MKNKVTILDAVLEIEQQAMRNGKIGYIMRDVETDELGFIATETLIDSQH